MSSSPHEVTRLIAELRKGDQNAVTQLTPILYGELRQLAARYLGRERIGHTLQATALVHEAYLKMMDQPAVQWQDRAHFLGIAACVMRQILVDYARGHHAAKRGGDEVKLSLDEGKVLLDQALVSSDEHVTDLI